MLENKIKYHNLCSHCIKFFDTEDKNSKFCPKCREKTEVLKCKECGEEFEISDNERNNFLSKGFSLPKRCRSCRHKNREKNKILNLTPHIGKKIKRIAPNLIGDRSFIGKTYILKKIEGNELFLELLEDTTFQKKGEIMRLEKNYNDGYWIILN